MEPSSEFKSSNYPNINNTHIHDGTELARLLSLAQLREHSLQELEPQLKEAQRNSTAFLQPSEYQGKPLKKHKWTPPTRYLPKFLLKRFSRTYRDQTSEMELAKATEEIKHLELRLSQVRADLKTLEGPMHPIRRCPTDILQYIFEWVVLVAEPVDRLKPATTLSHVCYRWREIALNTPKFWSYLEVSLKHPPERIESVWSRATDRIRMCPATITINDIGDENETWDRMKKCRLDLVSNIDILTFSLNSNNSAERLATHKLFLPTGPVGTLQIEKNWTSSAAGIMTLDPSRILNRFPSLKKVWIKDFEFSNFSAGITFPDITHLFLFRSRNVPLNLLAKAFPGLEKLLFWNTDFRPHSGEYILWPKLDTLTPYSTEGIPWHRLKLPKLTQLVLPNLGSPEGIIERLPAYPSLRHFHFPELIGYSEDIIKNAPQTVCLTLPASESTAVLQLSCLLVLRLIQKSSEDLSCELLEEIIRKHFLPSRQLTRDERQLAIDARHPDRLLRICIPSNGDFALRWRGSPLLPLSLEESLEPNLWLGKYQTYCFKWK